MDDKSDPQLQSSINGKYDMGLLKNLLILCCTMLVAITLGNLFLHEVKKARDNQSPWYVPYVTLPGLLVLAAVLGAPLLIWLIRN